MQQHRREKYLIKKVYIRHNWVPLFSTAFGNNYNHQMILIPDGSSVEIYASITVRKVISAVF